MYIYKITNIKNNKIYIGQSIRPIEDRFKRHINDAMNNILNTHFARAIRKYGKDSFKIEIIDTAENENELTLKEQNYIRLYNSVKFGYNETDAIYKCGGNTYKSKTTLELKEIGKKISKSKLGEKNPHHRSVKVLNTETNKEFIFKTIVDCQNFFKEKHHRFITNRVTGKTKSLYKGIWNIAYINEHYSCATKLPERHTCCIKVTNNKTNDITIFTSIRKMCKTLKINRSKIKLGKNIILNEYYIEFG